MFSVKEMQAAAKLLNNVKCVFQALSFAYKYLLKSITVHFSSFDPAKCKKKKKRVYMSTSYSMKQLINSEFITGLRYYFNFLSTAELIGLLIITHLESIIVLRLSFKG